MIPGAHPAATATLVTGDVEADVACADGTSYTLRVPVTPNQSYAVPANSNAWVSGGGTPQGTATAASCGASPGHGIIRAVYFSSLGISPKNATAGGPGITTTDAADPLDVEFSCSVDGASTGNSAPVDVNLKP